MINILQTMSVGEALTSEQMIAFGTNSQPAEASTQ